MRDHIIHHICHIMVDERCHYPLQVTGDPFILLFLYIHSKLAIDTGETYKDGYVNFVKFRGKFCIVVVMDKRRQCHNL